MNRAKKPKMIVRVSEGPSGILSFDSESGTGEYRPDYDTIRPAELARLFYSLPEVRSSHSEPKWIHTTLTKLHTSLFIPHVRYEGFLGSLPEDVRVEVPGHTQQIGTYISLMRGEFAQHILGPTGLLRMAAKSTVIWLHNFLILRMNPETRILFQRYGSNDFRTKKMKETFERLCIRHFEVHEVGAKFAIKNMLSGFKTACFIALESEWAPFWAVKNILRTPVAKEHAPLMKNAFRFHQIILWSFLFLERFYLSLLKNSRIRFYYGIDDTNFVFPVLAAAKKCGIKSIGHQHGNTYVPLNLTYQRGFVPREEYFWFDKIIVWGEFWKRIASTFSGYYPKDLFEVGPSKAKISIQDRTSVGITGKKGVLIPFEFLTDMPAVGQYVSAFLALGHRVFFKIRPDSPAEEQVACLRLSPADEQRVTILQELTDSVMREVDYVAGTFSTFLFDLAEYQKILLVLDCRYRFLQFLEEAGVGYVVRLESLTSDLERATKPMSAETARDFLSEESLEQLFQRTFMEDIRS